jgi:hypothetical protein
LRSITRVGSGEGALEKLPQPHCVCEARHFWSQNLAKSRFSLDPVKLSAGA